MQRGTKVGAGGMPSQARTVTEARRTRLLVFALVAAPIAGYLTGSLYGTPDPGPVALRPSLVPASGEQLQWLSVAAVATSTFASLAAGAIALLFCAPPIGGRTSVHLFFSKIPSHTALLGVCSLVILTYLAGYYFAGFSAAAEHSCL